MECSILWCVITKNFFSNSKFQNHMTTEKPTLKKNFIDNNIQVESHLFDFVNVSIKLMQTKLK